MALQAKLNDVIQNELSITLKVTFTDTVTGNTLDRTYNFSNVDSLSLPMIKQVIIQDGTKFKNLTSVFQTLSNSVGTVVNIP
jgi:hypothetical protein